MMIRAKVILSKSRKYQYAKHNMDTSAITFELNAIENTVAQEKHTHSTDIRLWKCRTN